MLQARRKTTRARFSRATVRAAALSSVQAPAPALRSATIKRARANAVAQAQRKLADVLRALLTDLTRGQGEDAMALLDSEMEALQVSVVSLRTCSLTFGGGACHAMALLCVRGRSLLALRSAHT